MLKMENWRVSAEVERDRFLGFTGEHLARRLEIRARVPGYACKLDLEFEDGQKNILGLTAEGGVLCTDIRREYVACHGRVLAQVRGLKGDEVIKSNVFELVIVGSVDAVDSFEPLAPGEFEQMERTLTGLKTDTEAAADRAAALTAKMPLPQDGTWHIWDEAADAYRDSGEPSRGERGETGEQGARGDTGEQGPPGVQGEKGEPFRYEDFTPEQLEALRGPKGAPGENGAAGGAGPQGPPGEKGDPGEQGPQGEKGETGEGFRLRDQFDSFAELEAAVPEPEAGSAYGVGTAQPYDVYIYSPSKGWVNHGPLQGAKGDAGPQGEKGEPGEQGPRGIPGETGPQGPKGDTGVQGPRGEPGDTGPQGPPGEHGAAFTYADFTAEQLEALRGPQGVPGEKGDTGAGDVSGVLFAVEIPADGWQDGAQAVEDSRFDAASRFAYVVSPDAGSYAAYTESGVHAVEVTSGALVFSAAEAPEEKVTVNILRLEVPENGKGI